MFWSGRSPILASLFLAQLLAPLCARGALLPEGLPVGRPGEAHELDRLRQDTLAEQLPLENDGNVFAEFPHGIVLNDTSSVEFPHGIVLNDTGSSAADLLMLNASSSENPEEISGAFEGDMILNSEQRRLLYESPESTGARNAIKTLSSKWSGGVIPYVIASGHFTSQVRSLITQGMQKYHDATCIRFVPRSTQSDYIYIYRGNGCNSRIGRQGGRQLVSLGNGCHNIGTVIHEFMHAAGFFHEQSRADRDSYVSIRWGNIKRGMENNFKKYSLNEISHLGQPYDLSSVMHYNSKAFSVNGQNTIVALNGASMANMGQRKGFSPIDLKKLNILYGCSNTGYTTNAPKVTSPVVTPPTSSCRDRHSQCAQFEAMNYCSSWSRYYTFMLTYCQRSCGKCSTAPAACQDGNRYCGTYAARGYCSNPGYARYMSLNCRRSCRLC